MAKRRGRSRSRGRPPLSLRRLRGWRRLWVALGVVVLAALLVLADRGGWLAYGGGDLERYDERVVRVARVVDGDTLEVALPDPSEGEPTTTVRLWGIDTPELARPWAGRAEAEPFADEARALARRLVAGERVRLDLEPHRLRGRYGRVLAYVELPGRGDSLNERLLQAGLAEAEDRWPHRHLERYELLELEARRAARGMWAER